MSSKTLRKSLVFSSAIGITVTLRRSRGLFHQKNSVAAAQEMKARIEIFKGVKGNGLAICPIISTKNHKTCTTVIALAKASLLLRSSSTDLLTVGMSTLPLRLC